MQSVISFEFASLNYTAPDKKQYAYKLEGFDEDWTYAGTRNNVTYTNLDPGDYNFMIKSLNNDGKWSNNITGLKLKIEIDKYPLLTETGAWRIFNINTPF